MPNSNPVAAGIPLQLKLLPQYLKQYGYKSHMVGKYIVKIVYSGAKLNILKLFYSRWHVGSCNLNYTPAKRGFDSFYGFFYGQNNYYTHRGNFFV